MLQAWKGRRRMDGETAIVVVDDDQNSREFIESSLDPLSRNISVFADCWSAWMHIKATCTKLVISDIYMSGMNGLDLLRSVKRVFPEVRCLMISADYSLETSVMELGADGFLCKPFKAGALIEMVRSLCQANGKIASAPARF